MKHKPRFLPSISLLCIAMILCSAAGLRAEGAWTSLFNGKDLTGWTETGDAIFKVRDGSLVGTQTTGKGGDLWTTAEYDNFELRFTYRMKWPANSGIWFRHSGSKGYQYDILKYKKPVAFSGTLYCPGKMFITKNLDESLENRDGWNEARLLADGENLILWLNGTKVGECKDNTLKKGKIGIQVHGGNAVKGMEIVLKKMEIRPAGNALSSAPAQEKKSAVSFTMRRVGNYRSEACEVGDFNNDGKPDIIAGPYLYLAPDWKKVKVRTLKGKVDEQGKGYMHDFMNAPLDADGDGLLDVVYVGWHEKAIAWFRNTGKDGGEWPETIVEVKDNFECGDIWDLDNDGKRGEVVPHTRETAWFEAGTLSDGKRGLIKHLVSAKKHTFGAGVGDVNGDGRKDILRPNAWYEAPADPRKGTWKEHPLSLGGKNGKADHTPQILVIDVNGDKLNDIITSSAHRHGLFWYEQARKGNGDSEWKQHTIDDSWSQVHSLTLADIDNDGDRDLVTGKRFFAHNGGDPGSKDPLGVYWYELTPGKPPFWQKHVISYKEGIGSGLNIPVVDMDGDGDLDVVVTGKWGGPVYFENQLKTAK